MERVSCWERCGPPQPSFFLLLSVPWDSVRVRNPEVYSRANVTRALVFFDLSLVGSSLAEL
jgi:hypothetical protein